MNYPYWSTRIFLRESPIIFESEEWFEWTLVDADVAINSFMWQNGGHSGPDQWDFAARPLRPPRWLRRWFNGVERSLSWPSQFKGGCLTKKHDYFLCKPWVWANWVDLLSDILWCSVSSIISFTMFYLHFLRARVSMWRHVYQQHGAHGSWVGLFIHYSWSHRVSRRKCVVMSTAFISGLPIIMASLFLYWLVVSNMAFIFHNMG